MILSPTRFEHLPNELLIEIFQWFDARTLYKAFYNLNQRLNELLQALYQLSVILSINGENSTFDHLFSSRVETLIVQGDLSFSLLSYPHVRRLILIHSKTDQISQAMLHGQRLQMISVLAPRCFYSTYNLHEKIFSDGYPSLTACCLTNVYSPSFELRRLSWHQSPSMRFAKISSRDAMIHYAVLSSCPNLQSFHLSMEQLDRTPIDSPPHQSLRQLRFQLNQWPGDRTIWESFFRFIPFLRRLIISRQAMLPDALDDLLQFDWLASVLPEHLETFAFSLYLRSTCSILTKDLQSMLEKFQGNFAFFHRDKAQRAFLQIFSG